jgi:hypothetical protein
MGVSRVPQARLAAAPRARAARRAAALPDRQRLAALPDRQRLAALPDRQRLAALPDRQ